MRSVPREQKAATPHYRSLNINRLMWSSTLIDELGYLAYDARAADLIFQLVSRRYEHRSLLITTNLPFKRWDTVFPNASCAVALIDRLTHHVEILLIEGRSYRRREAELSQQERNRQHPHRDGATE